MSGIELSLPEELIRSMKLPPGDLEKELLKELAVALYARGVLGFGKARLLAKMSVAEFQLALGRHGVSRHYDASELEDDIEYARSDR